MLLTFPFLIPYRNFPALCPISMVQPGELAGIHSHFVWKEHLEFSLGTTPYAIGYRLGRTVNHSLCLLPEVALDPAPPKPKS